MTSIFLSLLLSTCTLGSMYALMALGPALLYRVFGIFNFAHGAIVCSGAYLYYFLFVENSLSLIWGVPALILSSFIVAAGVSALGIKPFLSLSPSATFVATLALGVVLESVIVMIAGPEVRILEPSYKGLELSELFISLEQIITVSITPFLFLLLSYFLSHTSFARKINAVSESRVAASSLGISSTKVLFFSVWMSVATAFVAGILLSYEVGLDPLLGVAFSFKAFVVMILGGVRNLVWLGVAGLLIAFLESSIVYLMSALHLSSAYRDLLLYILLIVVLIFRSFSHPSKERRV